MKKRFLPRSRAMTLAFGIFNAGMLMWLLSASESAAAQAFILAFWAMSLLALGVVWAVVERGIGRRDRS